MFGTATHFMMTEKEFLRIFLQRNGYSTVLMPMLSTLYSKEMCADFLLMKDFLNELCPSNPGNILDIGCGTAGIDYFLYTNFEGSPLLPLGPGHVPKGTNGPGIHLVDKEGMYKPFEWPQMSQDSTFVGDLTVAREFLVRNGIPAEKIFTYSVPDFPSQKNQFGLVISLISWGFHYPLTTYLDKVMELLSPDGLMIFDMSTASNEFPLVQERFQKVYKAISYAPDAIRVVCKSKR